MCIKSPLLWKEVNVHFRWNKGSFNEVASNFSEKLSKSTTHLFFNFSSPFIWFDRLNFQEFCINLNKRCPRLQSLVLVSSKISVSLLSAIDACSRFLSSLEVLKLRNCRFSEHLLEETYGGVSNVKVLDLYSSNCRMEKFEKYSPIKMTHLKKLYLGSTDASDFWLRDTSLLQSLEVLQVGRTGKIYYLFRRLLNYACNITVLFLCWTNVCDVELELCNEGFPNLNTICLKNTNVTFEGVVFLVQFCQSLQNVYASKEVAKMYAEHPFVAANKSKLNIVKAIKPCCEPLDLLNDL